MKHNLPYLQHILEEIEFLLRQTHNLTFEDFMTDELLKRASARSFEIIGEAAKNLSLEFKDRYPRVDWKKLTGMRDKIIHYYFGVNYNILWQTIKDRLPHLQEEIKDLAQKIT